SSGCLGRASPGAGTKALNTLGDRLADAFRKARKPKRDQLWVFTALGLMGTERHLAKLGHSINEDTALTYPQRKERRERRPRIVAIFIEQTKQGHLGSGAAAAVVVQPSE
ncbi:MAG: hypothetical protein AAFX99_26165, partial [Myxococcota bacterium]